MVSVSNVSQGRPLKSIITSTLPCRKNFAVKPLYTPLLRFILIEWLEGWLHRCPISTYYRVSSGNGESIPLGSSIYK
jgi:hypothetical protein